MATWPDPSEPMHDRDHDDPAPPREDGPPDSAEIEQKAPGAGEEDPTGPADAPMRADAGTLDRHGIAREPVGDDNIREGRVTGVMGPAHASRGQGQGG